MKIHGAALIKKGKIVLALFIDVSMKCNCHENPIYSGLHNNGHFIDLKSGTKVVFYFLLSLFRVL